MEVISFICKKCRQQVEAISLKGWCAPCRSEYATRLRGLGQAKPKAPKPPPPPKIVFETDRERQLFELGVLQGKAMATVGWERGAAWKRYYDARRKLQ